MMASPDVSSLRWKWVQSFAALVRENSQVAAARRLGISQPTVREHMDKLQTWLGFYLGDGHSPYVLNRTGKRFLFLSRRISRELGRLRLDTEFAVEDFDFEWIEFFCFMRKYRSQYAVANILGVNQSTVSRKLRALEAWLGFALFEGDGSYDTTGLGAQFFLEADRIRLKLLRFRQKIEKEKEDYERFLEERGRRDWKEVARRLAARKAKATMAAE